jgi:hypothetical protein
MADILLDTCQYFPTNTKYIYWIMYGTKVPKNTSFSSLQNQLYVYFLWIYYLAIVHLLAVITPI